MRRTRELENLYLGSSFDGADNDRSFSFSLLQLSPDIMNIVKHAQSTSADSAVQ